MKVIVLAAGRSKRLKPIEDKNFLEFLGKPLIQLQLEQMAAAGLKDFIVVGGAHNLLKLKRLAKTMKPTFRVVEQKNLDDGMSGAILSVERYVKNDSMMVVSANDVVDVDAYKNVLAATKDRDFECFLIGKKVKEYFPGGYLKVRPNGQITGIVEKPGKGKEPSKMVNLVIHYYRNASLFIQTLKTVKTTRDDRYEVALDSLMKSGTKMKVVPYEGFWQPVKYPWHVLDLMDYFLSQIPKYFGKGAQKALTAGRILGLKKQIGAPDGLFAKNVTVAKSATIRGDVYLDEGVRVFENAVIVGPAYIGKNTIVATNALVRGSNVGANCIVGFGTEVARSFWGHDVWTHTNYVGDSVLGNDVSFGSGTVTGNLRLDERNIMVTIQDEKTDSGRNKFGLFTGDHVRCGINTSFMPGIKIGNNSFIGAGITVAQDIPDGTFVYAKTELMMKPNQAKLDTKQREKMKNKLR